MAVSHFVILSVLLLAVSSTVINHKKCRGSNSSKNCQISQVRITPCDNPNSCEAVRGTNATLSLDFTPNFVTTKLKTMATWQSIPFPGMDDDACKYTSCPTVPGAQQTLNYNLHISSMFPPLSYTVLWKVWNADNDTEDVCCFQTTIKIE